MKSGFWRRFVASMIIDWIIVAIMFVPAQIALNAGPHEERACFDDDFNNDFDSEFGDEFDTDFNDTFNATCSYPTGAAWAMWGVLAIAGLAAALFYYAQTQGKTGQSWGYMALGIKLVDINTGQPVGPGRAIGRYFARILSAIPCYLGFFWMLWDPQKQTWHDKMTSSVVIRT